ncbi:MAG: complex I NDUFA9 subunit family protein [Pseudomonadota bacterium]
MTISKVCIIGGTGFVGHHLIPKLANAGIACRIPARRPHRFRSLEVLQGCELATLGKLDSESLQQQFTGCDAVINLLGILNESSACSFDELHAEAPRQILEAARHSGVKRLLHMSALNADETNGASNYLKSKGKGENLVHSLAGSVAVTSFRPSVIFGEHDSFINRFAQLMMIPGPLPLACPEAKFSPVFVGDVTAAFLRALEDDSTFGRHYELCGPRTLSLEEIVAYIAKHKGINKTILPLGAGMSRLQARILGMMPGKPFTMDNYNSLQQPSVCTQNGLQQLGIKATDMDAVVPQMLG